MMAVILYASRVILEVLGIEDYGIYNVIGGIVVLFAFINDSMVTSTQRFLNYELGRNNQQEAARVFSASLTLHLFIVVITFLLAETIGLWFLYNYIKYPPEREFAVLVTYQFSILTTCANMIRAPYNAAIISYERMGFFARISVIEAVAKLAIVYLLAASPWDKLISYAALMFGAGKFFRLESVRWGGKHCCVARTECLDEYFFRCNGKCSVWGGKPGKCCRI